MHRMRSVDLWHNVQYTLCLSRHCVTLECSILWRAPGVSHCVSGSYQVCQIISTSQAGTRGRSGREKGGDVFRHLDLIVFHFIMCFTTWVSLRPHVLCTSLEGIHVCSRWPLMNHSLTSFESPTRQPRSTYQTHVADAVLQEA